MLQVIQAVSTNLPEFSTVGYYLTGTLSAAEFSVHLLVLQLGLTGTGLKTNPSLVKAVRQFHLQTEFIQQGSAIFIFYRINDT